MINVIIAGSSAIISLFSLIVQYKDTKSDNVKIKKVTIYKDGKREVIEFEGKSNEEIHSFLISEGE